MPKYWMITNRSVEADGLGSDLAALTYYVSDAAKLDAFAAWKCVTAKEFQAHLQEVTAQFPVVADIEHEKQKHLTVFVHGYNNTWQEAAQRYQQITDDLYAGKNGLGVCVLFTWPSDGSKLGYLPDREDARASGPGLAEVFNALYEHALAMQRLGPLACRAKVSVIAHSMGNWVLQNALRYTWQRQNKPLWVSLINQCLMVAADVDNDVFAGGEAIGNGAGEGMANLCYRIVALYSGRDSVLGLSAGLKHFGKRRLGRSGLDRQEVPPDNVCDLDCSALFPKNERDIHSAYFWTKGTQAVIRDFLRGYDRGIVTARAEKLALPK